MWNSRRVESINIQEGQPMQRRYAAIVAGTLAGMISMAALAAGSSDWVAIKSPNELRALYSNKTFTGKGPFGNTFVAYYRSDGRGVVVANNQRIPRTWAVKGDEVCVTDASGTNCFQLQRNKLHPNEIFARQTPDHWAVFFTVKDGVPKF
jgi:hypothetical protein